MAEHDDHPTYITLVVAEYGGNDERFFTWGLPDGTKLPMNSSERRFFSHQQHALIYTDGFIAITLFECCYAMWLVKDGSFQGGSLWRYNSNDWKLEEASLNKIREMTTDGFVMAGLRDNGPRPL